MVAIMLIAIASLPQGFPPGGIELLDAGALETAPLSGGPDLATSDAVGGARKVTVRKRASETNAVQLQLRNRAPVKKGDRMLAAVRFRGRTTSGNGQARLEFLFEKASDPWTKSSTQPMLAPKDGGWKRHLVAFESVEDYAPQEAMVSLRLAFEPQTIEIDEVRLVNYRQSRTLDSLNTFALEQSPLNAVIQLRTGQLRQTMRGFGGNFCQPRYGSSEAMDPVGRANLDTLNVVHARVGLPLNHYLPEPGVFREEGPALASLQALQMLAKRGIPLTVSVWEGPEWMLGGKREQMGRTLDPNHYDACIDAILRYLTTARDQYGAHVDTFSFNEPDYGVNFKFTSQQMAEFIRKAGPAMKSKGLKTRFLVADTANGSSTADYARPLLEDRPLAEFLGPISLHNWDALSASDEAYTRIAQLAKRHGKEVWCLEAGHDAALWQKPNPWAAWENAFRTALAYERTIRLTEATLMDYWTYQDNYPLHDKSGGQPYPVFHMVKRMEEVFAPGSRVFHADVGDGAQALGARRRDGTVGLMVLNETGAGRATLQGLPAGRYRLAMLDTSNGGIGAEKAVSPARGQLVVEMPPRSVAVLIQTGAAR